MMQELDGIHEGAAKSANNGHPAQCTTTVTGLTQALGSFVTVSAEMAELQKATKVDGQIRTRRDEAVLSLLTPSSQREER